MQSKYIVPAFMILAICSIASAGLYHYSSLIHHQYLSVNKEEVTNPINCTPTPAAPQANTDNSGNVGHIFWESVTRLIVSAKK